MELWIGMAINIEKEICDIFVTDKGFRYCEKNKLRIKGIATKTFHVISKYHLEEEVENWLNDLKIDRDERIKITEMLTKVINVINK